MRIHRDWRTRLDGRIDRCPGCDQWRWDRFCTACDTENDEKEAA